MTRGVRAVRSWGYSCATAFLRHRGVAGQSRTMTSLGLIRRIPLRRPTAAGAPPDASTRDSASGPSPRHGVVPYMPGNAHGPREDRIVGRGLCTVTVVPTYWTGTEYRAAPIDTKASYARAGRVRARRDREPGPGERLRQIGRSAAHGGPMHPLIRDRVAPCLQPGVERVPGENRRPASALRLTYFTPLSTLPFVRPIRLTGPRRIASSGRSPEIRGATARHAPDARAPGCGDCHTDR